MYRKILMNEEHTNFQRIFWRETKNEQLKVYSLFTVTYSTSAGSYLAIKTLQQLADDELKKNKINQDINNTFSNEQNQNTSYDWYLTKLSKIIMNNS